MNALVYGAFFELEDVQLQPTASQLSVSVFADLAPGCVRVEEATDADWESTALPAERSAVEGAVESRVREFAAGRSCSRRALQSLGVAPQAIAVGPERQAIWPRGIVGSITHTDGYCAAAVAGGKHLSGLGIDAEKNIRLSSAVRGYVMGAQDTVVGTLRSLDVGTLVFSAKEAFFKAWFPQTAQWLEYDDIAVVIDAARQTFTVSLVHQQHDLVPAEAFCGRWAATKDFVFTASWLTAG